MAIIFSEEDLKDVRPPCVIQSFINHNAVLYKVFVVGDSYTVVERPSLKNFPAGPSGEATERQTGGKGDGRAVHSGQTVQVAQLLLNYPIKGLIKWLYSPCDWTYSAF